MTYGVFVSSLISFDLSDQYLCLVTICIRFDYVPKVTVQDKGKVTSL